MKKIIASIPKFVWLFIGFVLVIMVASVGPDYEKNYVMWAYVEEGFKTVSILIGQPYAYTALFSTWEAGLYIIHSYMNLSSENAIDRWVAERFGNKIILVRIFCIGIHFIFLFVQLWTLSIVRHQASRIRGVTAKGKKIAYFLAYPAATVFGGAVHLIYNVALTPYIGRLFIAY